jgi:hypothetical protein
VLRHRALPTSAQGLPAVLALCPPGPDGRLARGGKRPTRSPRPLQAWEPLLYRDRVLSTDFIARGATLSRDSMAGPRGMMDGMAAAGLACTKTSDEGRPPACGRRSEKLVR